jgi:hypothetical protein
MFEDNILGWFLQSLFLRGITGEEYPQCCDKALYLYHPLCPSCFSDDLTHYYEEIVVYDRHFNKIGTKDWGSNYSAHECNDCGWEDF